MVRSLENPLGLGIQKQGAHSVTGSCVISWIRHPSERRDLYHRIRVFPPDVAQWRDHLIRLLIDNPKLSQAIRPSASEEEIRRLVDEGISFLREVTAILVS